ncbi:LuxR C-terminal-related transcriptional regulator [Agromyces sp. NPDC058136]|uniref:LuxR C-terminal-related transcriptional regulator n=1 Tax=Agromyces sp. NPDC058136 TaxID=3346354 RepID=UPI0036DCF676
MGSTPERPRPAPRHRSSTEAFEDTRAVVELLARHRLVVAPHVAARLGLALGGDADAIIEVTARLRSAQRLGHAVLPDPLPLVPAIDAAVALEAAKLTEWERTLLVAASVCVDDRVDVLLAASGRPMVELIEGEVSRHLLLVAGHFAFADPRMRIWAHGTATLAERTAAHAALAEAYPTLGGERQSTWHRSLSTLEGSAEFVAPLLAIADAADAAGESEWAHAVAREAASHASGRAAIEAWRIAGRAALHGGHVEDARGWLGAVVEHGDELERAAVLADYLVARAALEGDVPLGELDDRLAAVGLLGVHAIADGPDDGAGGGSSTPQPVGAGALATLAFDLVRASGTAAGLLAERGAPAAAARRLADAARLTRGFRLDPAPLQSATAWCAMYGVGTAGDADGPGRADGPEHADRAERAERADATGAAPAVMSSAASIARAIERGLGGDPEGAARWLGSLRETSPDPRLAREDRSPIMRAARAVATSLLVLWAGDVGRAGQVLARAATDLPIALPFGGLGAALARRICVVASGEVDAFARAVEAAQPPSTVSIRAEELIDRAVNAHLRGARAESATLVALAGEREQVAGCGLHLPGLDAVSGWSVAVPTATGLRRPPDAILASELRRRMRSTDRHGFEADYRAAVDASRGIGSPYERARTELMLARACGEAGAPERAHRHLVTAEHLFTESGAAGWLAAVAAERRVLAVACGSDAPGEASDATPGEMPAERPAEAPPAGPTGTADDAPLAGRPVVETLSRANPNALPGPDRGPSDALGPDELLEPDDPLAVCRSVWTDILTERELEVAMLVVDGASNRDAAARLYVSVRTVEVHLGRVFTKLDVHSRVELAVLAHRMRGLSSASRAR